MTVGTCAAASAAAAEQRAPTVVLMVVSGCAVAMFMTIGYELIYSFIEIRRYEVRSEDTKAKVRRSVESQESRSQKGCHEDESSEEPVAPGAWEL